MYVEKRELRVALDNFAAPIAMDIVSSDKSGSIKYQVSNISRTGMFLETLTGEDSDLEEGASIHFSLDLPKKVQGVAKVRWVRAKTMGPYLKKGLGLKVIEFQENAENTYLKFLEESLENLCVTDLMQPKFGIVKTDETIEKALTLLSEENFEVVVVTNDKGAPKGIFSKQNAVEIALNQLPLSGVVTTVMDSQIITITTSSKTEDVYAVMRYGSVDHLPVEENGKLVGMISIRDLIPFWSEQMDLQSKRISKNYDQVVSVMAHDLRTPITVIKTANYLIEDGSMSVEELADAGLPEIVNSSCETMLKLIDGILDSSQIRNGNLSLKREVVDIEEIIDRVARCFSMYAATKKIDVEVDIPLAVPKIRADSLRIEQVLNNLVGNAVKFCKENDRIVIGLKSHHSTIALWVADNGPGIPTNEQDQLFEEYVRTSVDPTAGEKCTGLGLAICKRIVDAHDGTIRVDSEVGEGTTFTILLPIEGIQ